MIIADMKNPDNMRKYLLWEVAKGNLHSASVLSSAHGLFAGEDDKERKEQCVVIIPFFESTDVFLEFSQKVI